MKQSETMTKKTSGVSRLFLFIRYVVDILKKFSRWQGDSKGIVRGRQQCSEGIARYVLTYINIYV